VAMRGPSASLVSLELAADASTFDAGLCVCDGSGVVRRSGLTRVGGSRRAVNSEVRRHSGWVLTRRVRQLMVRSSEELAHLAGSPTPWVSPLYFLCHPPPQPSDTRKKRPTSLVGGERPGYLAFGG